MPEHTATEFLARHPGVTSLIITQLLEVEEAHKISFASVAATLPRLLQLGLYSDCTDMYGDVEYYPMEIDISSIGDLRSLTHLTIDHCTLGPGFSSVLAKLPLLVELDLSGSGCTEGIVVVGLSHLLLVSMRHSDIPELLISDCAALHTVAAGFSDRP